MGEGKGRGGDMVGWSGERLCICVCACVCVEDMYWRRPCRMVDRESGADIPDGNSESLLKSIIYAFEMV